MSFKPVKETKKPSNELIRTVTKRKKTRNKLSYGHNAYGQCRCPERQMIRSAISGLILSK